MMLKEIISKCILQVRRESPFFASLMLFAPIIESAAVETAATDGKSILVNNKFFKSLNSSEQNAVMLHEVLHLALLHVLRMNSRDPQLWNIAADIVVNDLIDRNTSFQLPKGAIRDQSFRNKSVEYVYEQLLKNPKKAKLLKLLNPDLLDSEHECSDSMSNAEKLEIETYWKDNIQVLQKSAELNKDHGSIPGGMEAEIGTVLEPEVDWRTALWKFVAKTPSDFDEYDRRFFYRGLYLEGLESESINVSVCIDTSGSVSDHLLEQFMGELKGILRSYPHVKCDLFYADWNLHGPYEIDSIEGVPKVVGRGGTSFIPFFKHIKKNTDHFHSNKALIYLTDGYGDFPIDAPAPTMWIVCKDGLETSGFPFGEVIRISTESFI
jgi:predicted metal-dependent peptidase